MQPTKRKRRLCVGGESMSAVARFGTVASSHLASGATENIVRSIYTSMWIALQYCNNIMLSRKRRHHLLFMRAHICAERIGKTCTTGTMYTRTLHAYINTALDIERAEFAFLRITSPGRTPPNIVDNRLPGAHRKNHASRPWKPPCA